MIISPDLAGGILNIQYLDFAGFISKCLRLVRYLLISKSVYYKEACFIAEDLCKIQN